MDRASKTIVVTGGARGIGFAAARKFAAYGYSIALIDRDSEQAQKAARDLEEGFGIRAIAVNADISQQDEVERAHTTITSAFGAIHVFVNSAAITDEKTFLDSSRSDWDRIFSVCLYGAMNCLHQFLPDMVRSGYGRVIFLASDSARLGQARLSYYAAAKAAVIALAKSVAQEVGRSGVTINVISPGATNTELRKSRETSLLSKMGHEKYDKRVKAVLKLYPAGRLGEPEDIASAIAFLASDEASWITGQVLSVNGGFTMV